MERMEEMGLVVWVGLTGDGLKSGLKLIYSFFGADFFSLFYLNLARRLLVLVYLRLYS